MENGIEIVLNDEYLLVIRHKSCSSDDVFYTLVLDKRTGSIRDDCPAGKKNLQCKHIDAMLVLLGKMNGKFVQKR